MPFPALSSTAAMQFPARRSRKCSCRSSTSPPGSPIPRRRRCDGLVYPLSRCSPWLAHALPPGARAISPRSPGGAEAVPLEREPVELGRVGAGDLEAVFGAGVLEVPRDDFL